MAAVAVIGNLARDLVDGQPPRVGGTVFHAARALRAAGADAHVVTKCAAADRAELLRELEALRVPVAWRASTATATFAFRYEGDRRVMRIEELGEPWTPEEIRDWVAAALGATPWVHVGPLARSDFSLDAVEALAMSRRLALDGQGLVRVAAPGPLELDSGFDRRILRHLTVLKLAAEEAAVALPSLAAGAVAELGVPEVIVTHGPAGSRLFAEGREHRIEARPVAADPTGAGDAFTACYVVERSHGREPLAAATRASRLVEGLLRGDLL